MLGNALYSLKATISIHEHKLLWAQGPGISLDPKAFFSRWDGKRASSLCRASGREACQTLLLCTGAWPWTLNKSFQELRMENILQTGAETGGFTQGRGNQQQWRRGRSHKWVEATGTEKQIKVVWGEKGWKSRGKETLKHLGMKAVPGGVQDAILERPSDCWPTTAAGMVSKGASRWETPGGLLGFLKNIPHSLRLQNILLHFYSVIVFHVLHPEMDSILFIIQFQLKLLKFQTPSP